MLRTPFHVPNLPPAFIRKFTAYLIRHGWTQVAHPNTSVILFHGPEDDENRPLRLFLPATTTFRDAQIRVAEALDLLAVIQQEAPASIFNQIMAINIEGLPEVTKDFGFLGWLFPIFHIDRTNAAFASSDEQDHMSTPKLIVEGRMDKRLSDFAFKVFSSTDGYEIVIQTPNADYDGRIVAFGSDMDSITLLGVISGGHEVYDGFVSNLFPRTNYSPSINIPFALVDEKALSSLFETGRLSEQAIEDSVNSTATSSGIKAWKRIAENEVTAESLRKKVESVLQKL
jgi:hypothetical protein